MFEESKVPSTEMRVTIQRIPKTARNKITENES